jgi:hypothetical protein
MKLLFIIIAFLIAGICAGAQADSDVKYIVADMKENETVKLVKQHMVRKDGSYVYAGLHQDDARPIDGPRPAIDLSLDHTKAALPIFHE